MKLTTTVLSILCLAVAGNLVAQHGGFGKGFDHSGPRDGAMRLQVLAVALDLTEEQFARAQDLPLPVTPSCRENPPPAGAGQWHSVLSPHGSAFS